MAGSLHARRGPRDRRPRPQGPHRPRREAPLVPGRRLRDPRRRCRQRHGLAQRLRVGPLGRSCPAPVFTGIDHERDNTVLDEIAHTRCDTPSKVIAGSVDGTRLLV